VYTPPLEPEPGVVTVEVNVTVTATTSQIQTVIVSDVIDHTQIATVHVTPTCAVSNVISSVTVTETLTTTTTQAVQTQTKNITLDDAAELAEEYRKNLTVDTKTTSSYLRTKTSAEDARQSSQTMGALGLLMVVVPLGAIIILDMPKIWYGLKSYNSVIGLPEPKPVNTVVKFESDLETDIDNHQSTA